MEIALYGDTNDPPFRSLLHSWLRMNPDHRASHEIRQALAGELSTTNPAEDDPADEEE